MKYFVFDRTLTIVAIPDTMHFDAKGTYYETRELAETAIEKKKENK